MLKHGDRLSLGPPELKDAVKITFHSPPSWWMRGISYGFYGLGGMALLFAVWIGLEWSKVPIRPLPSGMIGPVVVYAGDGVTPLNPVRQEKIGRAHV